MPEGLILKYFVLKPKGTDIYALASRAAMIEYADRIQDENPNFAANIRAWVGKEQMAANKILQAEAERKK